MDYFTNLKPRRGQGDAPSGIPAPPPSGTKVPSRRRKNLGDFMCDQLGKCKPRRIVSEYKNS
jgi:hypothetical protein